MTWKHDKFAWLLMGTLAFGLACGDDDSAGEPGEDPEVITTVRLNLTTGSSTITASWQDLDGPGGAAPVIVQPTALTLGSTYTASLEILNESESPAENVTEEIRAEAEEHLIFYVPTNDIITVEITDTEMDYGPNSEGQNLPVGLEATVTATAAGTGTLQIVLNHLPPINNTPQKTPTNTINDGEADFDITFNVTVQ